MGVVWGIDRGVGVGERGWCNAGEIGVASVGVGEVGVRFIVEDMVIVVEVGPT